MSKILNLGCGKLYREGQVNVDFYAEKVDVRHDLNSYPYPFPANTFDQIYCLNIIEHLIDVMRVMEEIHRIGKDGCRVTIRVPHFRSACLYEDLTHKHGFAWKSMDIFCADPSIYGEYKTSKFKMIDRYYTHYKVKYLYDMLSRFPVITDNLLSKYIPMASIMYIMEVISVDRY